MTKIGTHLTECMFALAKELYAERHHASTSNKIFGEWNPKYIANEMAEVIIYLTELTLIFQNQDDVQSCINDRMAMRKEIRKGRD